MKIAEALLPKLSEWEFVGSERQNWCQPVLDTGWTVTLTADRVDTYSCLLWELTLARPAAAAVTNAELKRQALALAERASGLMEPLRFIELDETRGEALLRSESPTQRSTSLAFYEVLMSGGRHVVLRRFQRNPDKNHRDQVGFVLTHEAIAKLVDDLVRE